jgi:hypothetical protein
MCDSLRSQQHETRLKGDSLRSQFMANDSDQATLSFRADGLTLLTAVEPLRTVRHQEYRLGLMPN